MIKAEKIRVVSTLFNCSQASVINWIKSGTDEHARRIDACIAALSDSWYKLPDNERRHDLTVSRMTSRTDWSYPEQGLSAWLYEAYGVQAQDVAEWYGFKRKTFYDFIKRFADKRPTRVWVMVDHYLKEHGHV